MKTTVDMGSISTFQTMLQASSQDGHLYLWQWPDLNAEPQKVKVGLWWPRRELSTPPLNLGSTLISSSAQVIYASHEDDDTTIVLRSINRDHESKRWSLGREWWCERLRNTNNGRFVAICLQELFTYFLKDESRNDYGRYRFGIIDCQADEIQWISTIYRWLRLPIISSVSVSGDGQYLAAVGTKNGGFIHLADVANKRVLWEKVPLGEEVPHGDWTVNFNDVSFSPDSNYVYVAGNCGLFCFDTATGKILSQWQTASRLVSVSISTDGRLVAGGTVATGFVYIWEAKTGKLVLKLLTGQHSIYGLAFSPDSTLLATSGVPKSNIKIWEMPPADSQGAKPQQSVNAE
ncbi:MAG: hypothetical protein JSV16_08100 [Candidatus Hydrogenedentota bacterium]|nr:MAG: hypothetical protein JSV16_08100 [Candidatus Hydrogenedentota bacterium]